MVDEASGAQAQEPIIVSTSGQQQAVVSLSAKETKKPSKKRDKNCTDVIDISKTKLSKIDNKLTTFRRSESHTQENDTTKFLYVCETTKALLKDVTPAQKHKIKLFFKKEGIKPTSFFIDADVSRVDWDLICKLSQKYSDFYKVPVFIGVFNWSCRLKRLTQVSENLERLMLLSSTKEGYYFLNQPARKEIKIKAYTTVNTLKYLCLVQKNAEICYSLPVLKEGKDYWCKGIMFPAFGLTKNRKTSTSALENVYIIAEAHEVKEEYEKLDEVLPHIKKIQDLSIIWDFSKDTALYSDEEIALLVMNTFYYGIGINAFNLVLCGEGDSSKSTYLKLLAEIFNEKVVNVNNSTTKGMVPSFYSDSGSLGSILQAHYIACLDDLFRLFEKEYKVGSGSIEKFIARGLQAYMTIFDRTEEIVSSGKAQFPIHMQTSFFATDNFKFKEELIKVYKEDEALCRRLCFLHLSEETKIKTGDIQEKDFNDVVALAKHRIQTVWKTNSPWGTMVLLYKYMRELCNMVKYDEGKIQSISHEVIFEQDNGAEKQHRRHFKSKVRALASSVCIIREILRRDSIKGITLEMQGEDYQLFRVLLTRLYKDYCLTFIGTEAKPKTEYVDMTKNKG
jgi:hypothetical protein